MTLAECEPGSLYDQFVRELGAAAIAFLQDADMYIDQQMDSGTMRFSVVHVRPTKQWCFLPLNVAGIFDVY